MDYFLEHIAKSIYSEYKNKLNRHCLVFPNRRAGLYFLKYLASLIEKPVWVPSILTINELFRSFSSLQSAGNEVLIFELYKVYRKVKKSPENFDDFYFWGDMLLNDFDDVDKYLVDASLVFRNIEDIKKIDQQFGGLTDTQVDIIRRFWINFNPGKPSREKSGFINIWSVLNDLYSGFKSSLFNQNLSYEGMVFREVAENRNKEFLPGSRWDMVHFIGFNALNECEKVIMTSFKDAGKARFYWDYDNSYISEGKMNSAGFFIRDNLKIFGNDMPSDWKYDTMLAAAPQNVSRRVIDTSSDVAQVKLMSQLIKELPDISAANAHHTAVVLADENLLMPVLTSLPENIGDINITMGHPLKQTLVYTFMKHLMDLQRSAITDSEVLRFGYREVLSILRHTLITGFLSESEIEITDEIRATNLIWVPSDRFDGSEYLMKIFKRPLTPAQLSDYFKEILSLIALRSGKNPDGSDSNPVQRNIINEFIYRVVLSINRLEVIVNSPDVTFNTDTYIRILDRMLRLQSVPFSGEPLSGVQIMGILETRTLDFKNLIILSVNEGVLPAVSAGSSFIPFTLREAFGLPSVNYQESIYAYHFYRLLQRAENVVFTYNSNSEGLRSGEMSRFLIQMKYNPAIRLDFQDLNFEIRSHGSIREILEKTEDHLLRLSSQYLGSSTRRILSPSAINTWLNCRMKFYYRYINNLKEPDKITTDIDHAMFGSILHDIMKNLYENYIGQVLTADLLGSVIRDKQLLLRLINESVNQKFNRGKYGLIDGNELVVREVIMAYLNRIIYTDIALAPFTILNVEDSYSFPVSIYLNGSHVEVLTGGQVDRIDMTGDVTRIVDYKSGAVADSIKSISDLFTDDRKKDIDCWLQTVLYCEAYQVNTKAGVVYPSVYKIKKMDGSYQSDKLKIKTDRKIELLLNDYSIVRDEFVNGLKSIIGTIFSVDEPFSMTTDIRGKCSYCPYRSLCIR